ncbi:phosphatase inhibitor-domain-containing protein [Lentinula guzmanii]|uniref:Type 1 phosphatases regulator n=1 Tax=Lentinula guzmanii TaxID=2804957 RepID=A0AA38MY04_9AGAR|nr:phosphatase inhibitor-domain-containing protein [Lentinula guzmanii]KAJ3795862.1 phosphatase inhibitor-domain-containing protein [Lentinula aff. detonsa]
MSFRTSAMRRPNTSAPGDGSRTITITPAPPSEDEGSSNDTAGSTVGALKLRATTRKPKQKVVWREDVVDNEGTGRKSSKICCIYHKPKAYDESSDEDDSDSDSDCPCDHDHAGSRHSHESNGRDREGLQNRNSESSLQHMDHDDPPNNAYEVAPSSSKGKRKAT